MRSRRALHLLLLVLLLFTLNGIAGVARACAAVQAAPLHAPLQGHAVADQPPCSTADAALCVEHYVQDAKGTDQKAPADLPTPAYAPPFRIVRAVSLSEPVAWRLAERRPACGPSLTILFGHLLI